MTAGDMVVIDSVVGQVSGRPIFADALLEPIAARLRSEAERLNAREFAQLAEAVVNERLMQVVLDELLLAEAEASLTEQQQMGLFALLRDVQEKTIASGQGSRLVTEQRLMEEEGITIEQYTEQERNTLLLMHLINRKVQPRVIVSWKDVQREYERRKQEFNAPSTVTLQWLRLSREDHKELIEQVSRRLAAGERFADVAGDVPAGAVRTLDPMTMGPGGIEDVQISETFRPHLAGLDVGQTTGAIQSGTSVNWLHVMEIQQQPARSLYDVQRQLEAELRIRREREERERYIRSLFAKGMHDELNEMSRRVLTVALLRYGR